MLDVSPAVSICRSSARCSVDWEDNPPLPVNWSSRREELCCKSAPPPPSLDLWRPHIGYFKYNFTSGLCLFVLQNTCNNKDGNFILSLSVNIILLVFLNRALDLCRCWTNGCFTYSELGPLVLKLNVHLQNCWSVELQVISPVLVQVDSLVITQHCYFICNVNNNRQCSTHQHNTKPNSSEKRE